MSIHVALTHHTAYRFDRPVALGPHVIRLRPAPQCRTPIESYSLTISPADHFINWQQDPFGNYLARIVFPTKATELSVTVDLVADMTVINPFDFFVEDSATHYPFAYDESLARDLAPYLVVSPDAGPLVDAWVESLPTAPEAEGWPINDFLVLCNQRLQGDIAYRIRMEPGVQTPEETLEKAIGSCRDTGWLLVQLLRKLGLAARFVSGYLVQLTADTPALDGPSGPEADFTDLHAWAEVYVPGAGWIGLDPTSGLFAGEGHIPLACTPEPRSAAPVTGATEPCEVEFEFANLVTRIHEDPRVTLPYSDHQWDAIDALGNAVDRDLAAGDVRLTMGGEPTFVSIDDMEGEEWTTVADGTHKRRLAADLTTRLMARIAPGGLRQHSQGKWYPGEPLPRWQTGIHWRTDGVDIWSDPALLADPSEPGTTPAGQARPLIDAIAGALGLGPTTVLGAFEDPDHRRWQAAVRGEPLDEDEPPAEATGWVLPLHRVAGPDPDAPGAWASSTWRFRRGALYLIPGDSPVGLRLPLDQLIGGEDAEPVEPDRSPFEPRGTLPDYARLVPGPPWATPRTVTVPTATAPARLPAPPGTTSSTGTAGADAATDEAADDEPAVPALPPVTALAVEVRDGHAHVFLPPTRDIEHTLDLVARIEAAARACATPVVLEGYPPPSDPRVPCVVVAPDPGVIEVNVQPASSWPELRDLVVELYEDARQSRLGTEKFMVDGLHSGTGGGNHLTLGGPTAADSPVLRRPDLLRSLLTYWQHHPSLSYLFSGRFIGPTSQAPRIDEGRAENLYELEIAFAELERHPEKPPWLVDRLLRHLLVDITGNTHRAEFCIDKLFSPDSERGRLGLVEMRAFEMPPHPRMALVQALLVRALVARFWDDPYTGRLVRWGTELHGRFLLPHDVEADITEVVEDLQRHGYPFALDWLAPFMEFRFPRIGTVQIDDVRLSLRSAIEPWLVLGEEVTATATSRYVDSSVERLQVEVHGFTPGRHLVTCNGVPVPLRPTAQAAHGVAGVRYRAWHPPSALHPTIGVHSPLTFDLIDTWNRRSLGGCRYHVSHPGGRAYETFPVNANEAEARRARRFEVTGHTPGPVDVDRMTAHRPADEYPGVLDLRRSSRG